MLYDELCVAELNIALNILQRLHNQTFSAARPCKLLENGDYDKDDLVKPRFPEAKDRILKCIEILQADINRADEMSDMGIKFGLWSKLHVWMCNTLLIIKFLGASK